MSTFPRSQGFLRFLLERPALAVRALAAIVPLFTAAPARAEIRIVGPVGATYTTVQAAIDAALDHDVILVRSGTYPGFGIADKSLTVVEDVGAAVQVSGTVSIIGLSASKTVVLRGLTGKALLTGSV